HIRRTDWNRNRKGNRIDRPAPDRSNRMCDEVGRRPHFVDVVESGMHDRREVFELPEPVADIVPAVEKRPAGVADEIRSSVGVDADDVDVERGPAVATVLEGM